jgi:cytochrome b
LARAAVWDLPTRLCHWALALCVLTACLSAHRLGGTALRVHFVSGYAVLTLVGFRVLWGFAGAQYARFAQFVRGPAATWRYARTLLARGAPWPAGHNPLGGWSVLALLAVCLLQAGSGLFARDDIASEGPLAQLVSESLVERAGALHAHGETALYVLVALHLAAIAFYRYAKQQRLLAAMISGGHGPSANPAPTAASDAGALVLLLLSGALVAYLVHLAP